MNINELRGQILVACSRGEPHADLQAAYQELRDFHQSRLNALRPIVRDSMVNVLRDGIPEEAKALFRTEIAANPLGWSVYFHFSAGMEIRNVLRQAGYGEKETGIDNLDNLWVPLVEEAVKEQP